MSVIGSSFVVAGLMRLLYISLLRLYSTLLRKSPVREDAAHTHLAAHTPAQPVLDLESEDDEGRDVALAHERCVATALEEIGHRNLH